MLKILKVISRDDKKGFTLIEIIVVLVILGILAAIAVPAVMGYIEDAKEAQYLAEVRAIHLVLQTEEERANVLEDNTSTFRDVAKIVKEKTGLTIVSMFKPAFDTTIKNFNMGTGMQYDFNYRSDDNKEIHVIIKKNQIVAVEIV